MVARCVPKEPTWYEALAAVPSVLAVTRLTAPPSASAPKRTGTTPRYSSTRSIRFTGTFSSPCGKPANASGMPSRKKRI